MKYYNFSLSLSPNPCDPLCSGILVDMLIRLLYSQLHQFWNHFGSAIYEHASADFQVLRKNGHIPIECKEENDAHKLAQEQ
jgi:hypothetical protein